LNLEIRRVSRKDAVPRKLTKDIICPVCKGDEKSDEYRMIKVQILNMVNNINSSSATSSDTKDKVKEYVENVYDSSKNAEHIHKVVLNLGEKMGLSEDWDKCSHCKNPNLIARLNKEKGYQIFYVKEDNGFIVFEEAISPTMTYVTDLKDWYFDTFSKWAPDIFKEED